MICSFCGKSDGIFTLNHHFTPPTTRLHNPPFFLIHPSLSFFTLLLVFGSCTYNSTDHDVLTLSTKWLLRLISKLSSEYILWFPLVVNSTFDMVRPFSPSVLLASSPDSDHSTIRTLAADVVGKVTSLNVILTLFTHP